MSLARFRVGLKGGSALAQNDRWSAVRLLEGNPFGLGDGQQVRGHLRGGVEVEAAQEGYTPGITVVLDSRLQRTLERHHTDERQRREQDQGEGVERGADTAGGGHQSQGDESA